jgi:hypothetical protein
MGLKFGEPPGSVAGKTSQKWASEAAELRDRPKEWAVVATKPTASTAAAMALNVRSGLLRAFQPAGSFEAISRGCDVWVRYVGEGGQ